MNCPSMRLALMPLCVFAGLKTLAAGSDSVIVRSDTIIVNDCGQRSFSGKVPPGNYSGIANIGNNRYAVVSDKSETDGFFVFKIDIDTVSGKIVDVENEGFRSAGTINRDGEGIAYFVPAATVFISGEADNRIYEYSLDGLRTGREIAVPKVFALSSANYGLESLTYNAVTHRFWTTTESTLPVDGEQATSVNGVRNRLRLQSFDDDLQPAEWFYYEMDAPESRTVAGAYAMGVSELCALDDGRLIVLEREFFVSRRKLGSYVNVKLYLADPSAAVPGGMLDKYLLHGFRTGLSLFGRSIANYEGMCIVPQLADGSMTLIFVSDSQDGYKGVLRDWFRTVSIRIHPADK